MQNRMQYADTLELKCTENDKVVVAEILDYRPAQMITCSIERSVKVYLRYNQGNKNYTGNVGKLEFVSTGPVETIVKQGR